QGALVLAHCERILRLTRGRLADERESDERLALAAAADAILGHIVDAAQLAALVGGAVAIHVAVAAVLATSLHGGLGGAALADDRQQRECGGGAVLEAEPRAQRLDLVVGEFLRLAAQQRLRKLDRPVAHALEAADLA